MSETRAAWDEVGNRFADLGKHVKDRYDANVGFGDADKEKLNNAMHEIRDALDAGFTALGDSLRDPTMRDEMKGAGVAVADALAATFNDVADTLRSSVRRDS
jgi:hypothetical protein